MRIAEDLRRQLDSVAAYTREPPPPESRCVNTDSEMYVVNL